VGKAAAQADGTARVTFIVPAGLATGGHTVVLTGLTSGLSTSSAFTVTAAPPTATPTSSAPVPAPAGSPGGSGGVQTPASLPATGTDGKALVLQAIAGFALISAGTLAVLAGRRRRRT
jgi:hypothetical protein